MSILILHIIFIYYIFEYQIFYTPPAQSRTNCIPSLIITYHPDLHILKQILRESHHILLSMSKSAICSHILHHLGKLTLILESPDLSLATCKILHCKTCLIHSSSLPFTGLIINLTYPIQPMPLALSAPSYISSPAPSAMPSTTTDVKLGTSSLWLETQTGAGITSTLE